MPNTADRTPRAIFLFWLPLALQWIMMALEGPFLAAVIARLADPTFNLAAYGVAFALAILVESPVIMLMSASTALVDDAHSYRKLRAFALGLNALATGLLLFLLVPPVFDFLIRRAMGVPPEVADLVNGSLWILLPWPAAIGYRRFLHGILIRAGLTRRVMWGTAFRLVGMGSVGLFLARQGLPGAWVGAGALSSGVVIEAVVARIMSRGAIRAILEVTPAGVTPVGVTPAGVTPAGVMPAEVTPAGVIRASFPAQRSAPQSLSARDPIPLETAMIVRFYAPLALTSFIGLTTQPILTFFMGRSPAPVESLALFPVVLSLSFLFGTLGLSFQEATIALVGRAGEHRAAVGRFARGLAVFALGGLALISTTPLARLWFEGVAGLSPEMAALAVPPLQAITVAPALSVLLGYQRGLLVQARNTRPITWGTAIEVTAIALLFPFFGWGMGWMGVTAAMAALVTGRALGAAFLTWQVHRLGVA